MKPDPRAAGLLERAGLRWRESPQALLRLALLRKLASDIHAQLSRALAQGENSQDTRVLDQLAQRISLLRERDLTAPELSALLGAAELPHAIRREIPPTARLPFDPAILQRYDRTWELSLVAEALALGWTLQGLERTIPADSIEVEATRVESELWPHAIFLFAENLGIESSGDKPLWRARWWFTHAPNQPVTL